MLTPNDPAAVSLPPGDGPRHFDFHPDGRWLYSIQEEGSNLVLFDYDDAKGRLAIAANDLQPATGFGGSDFYSELSWFPLTDRFVYAGSRLHDSIGHLLRRPTTASSTFVSEIDKR